MGKCVLSGGSIGEWGNNPYPLAAEGECCDVCNAGRVLPERIRLTEKTDVEGIECTSAR